MSYFDTDNIVIVKYVRYIKCKKKVMLGNIFNS